MIEREKFYNSIRDSLFGGSISVSQFAGIDAILNEYENNHAELPLSALGYILATVYHETDKTMQPIREKGGKDYFIRRYFENRKVRDELGNLTLADAFERSGRGLVQLTGRRNDGRVTRELGIDLINHPEKALEMETAVKILFWGMIGGKFTGKKLAAYFSAEPQFTDFYNARRIINGTDCANKIATEAELFYAALKTKS
jgi:putative chitinase